MVKSSPGVSSKPRFGPNLDSTAGRKSRARRRQGAALPFNTGGRVYVRR